MKPFIQVRQVCQNCLVSNTFQIDEEKLNEKLIQENKHLKNLLQHILNKKGKSILNGLTNDGIIVDELSKEIK